MHVPDIGALGIPAQLAVGIGVIFCGAWCFREGMLIESTSKRPGWIHKAMMITAGVLVLLGLSPIAMVLSKVL